MQPNTSVPFDENSDPVFNFSEGFNASQHAARVNDNRVNYTVAILSTAGVYVIGLFIISANTLVLLAISKTDVLKDQTHWLVANLAVSDLGMGVYMIVLFPFQVLIDAPSLFCMFAKYYVNIVIVQSYVALLMITIDRYIAVTRPLHYHQTVTYGILRSAIASSWTYSVILSTTVFINDRWFVGSACAYELIVGRGALYFLSANFFVNVIVMLTVYVRIGCIALKHTRGLAPLQHQSQTNATDFGKQIRLAKMLFIVVGAFAGCWLPFYIMVVVVNSGLYKDTTGTFR